MRDYTDYLIEAILQDLDESAKTDFRDKFGQDTLDAFDKARERFNKKGISVDYTKYLKMDKQDVMDTILSVYDDKKDAAKKRAIAGETRTVRGKYKFFGEIDGYLVYQPLDYIASMDLGINTGWCTTGRYDHAGHPEFTPSKEDARKHFNDYTKKGIKLYYFLNPNTFYGEYALALYPKILTVNKKIYDKLTNKVLDLKETNYELFNAEDVNVWYNTKIIDMCKNELGLNLLIKANFTDLKVTNGFEIEDGILVKYYGEDKNIVVPDSVISIGDFAFQYCANLTSITLPDSVTSIGLNAFNYCLDLTSITIPDSVTSIGESAFACCESLTSITLPNKLTNIERGMFSGCTGLTSITIPDSVVSIGEWAFSFCTGLTSITIPAKVESIGQDTFRNCTSLKSVTIPDSVTKIWSYAFTYCIKLTNVSLPNSIKLIDADTFSNCRSLTSITIPEGVTSIGDRAFADCSGLISITIPDSVTSIGDMAFYGCVSLKNIVLPDGITSIRCHTFSYCESLKDIAIPNSVTSIGSNAFHGCKCYFFYDGNNKEVINELLAYGDILNEETGEIIYMAGQTV